MENSYYICLINIEDMKNIHVVPTDKPSRLFIIDKSKMFKPEAPYLSFSTVGGRVHKVEGSELYQPQNIYITSDEDLIIGGYHFNSKYRDEPQKTNQRDIDSRKYWEQEDYYVSKIILTTDPLLIEHGVQKIDDDFLEWFVKNSDCEFVGVEKYLSFGGGYQIIIPEWISPMQKFKKKQNTTVEKQGTEQLELENAAENEYPEEGEDSTYCDLGLIQQDAFRAGANWMAERMYSEDEVKDIVNKVVDKTCTYFHENLKQKYAEELFEQFKK